MAENKTEAELQAEADAKAEADKKTAEERANESDEDRIKREADEALQKEHENELERERKRREKAEKAAADAAFKLREQKRSGRGNADDEEDDQDDDDKPLTKRQLDTILARDRQNTRREVQGEIIAEKAKKFATSTTEAELIIEVYKNRVFPEGMTLDEQLEEAHIIANGKRIIQKNQELTRALQGKENASHDALGSHRDPSPSQEPKITSADLRAITAAGFAWDGRTRLYIKQLQGGKKILTYDPKTKKRSVLVK